MKKPNYRIIGGDIPSMSAARRVSELKRKAFDGNDLWLRRNYPGLKKELPQ
jgi:hypothetical protein